MVTELPYFAQEPSSALSMGAWEKSYATALVGKHWGWFGSVCADLVLSADLVFGADLAVYVWFTDEVSFALACKAYTGTLIWLCTNWSLRGLQLCMYCVWPCWCGVDLALVFLHHYIYSLLCACGFSFIHRAAAESAVWGLGSKQSQFNWDEVFKSGLKMSVLTQQTPIIEQMLST